ncbi:MAG: hypothetical protein H0X46_09170, partial [Bacteroidetes bacterium]|nr:hypothetical protein [Bacteroidota bacterium]
MITIKYDWRFELAMVVGQVAFQLPFIYKRALPLKFDYFLNMLLVSLIGSLLLVPMIFSNRFLLLDIWLNISYFSAVVL